MKKAKSKNKTLTKEQRLKNNEKSTILDPLGKEWILTGDTIHFAGKTGIGDVMLGLNTAFYVSNFLKKKLS
jgi:hypothetical protein